MTVNDIIQDSLDLFDEPGTSRYNKDGSVLLRRIINRKYREVCRKSKCARTKDTFTTVSGTQEYSFPAGCVGIQRLEYLPIGLIRGKKMNLISFQEIGELQGTPSRYYIEGEKIGLDPLPDAEYTITRWYFQTPTAELAGTDSPNLVPSDWQHVIAYGTVYELFKIDKGDTSQGALKWKAMYENELREMKEWLKNGVAADKLRDVM